VAAPMKLQVLFALETLVADVAPEAVLRYQRLR
jgi:hypothetical protein